MAWLYQYLINAGLSTTDSSIVAGCIFILLIASIMSLIVHLFK